MRRSGRLHATRAGVAALALSVAGCTSPGSRAKQMPEGGGVAASGGPESTPAQVAAAQATESTGGGLTSPPSAATAAAQQAARPSGPPVTVTAALEESLVTPLREHYDARVTEYTSPGLNRTIDIIITELARYPDQMLKDCVTTVLVVGSIEDANGTKGGGTYLASVRCLYIVGLYPDEGWTEQAVAGAVHHELSSLVFNRHRDRFPEALWLRQNPIDYRYDFRPDEGGSAAVAAGMGSRELKVDILQQGFLSRYAQSSLEDDYNETVKTIMVNPGWISQFKTHYPRVYNKMILAMRFYRDCYPEFVPPDPLSEQPRPAPEPRVQEPRR